MKNKNRQEVAGIIRDFLREQKLALPQTQALELAAKLEGRKDLHHAQAEDKKLRLDPKKIVSKVILHPGEIVEAVAALRASPNPEQQKLGEQISQRATENPVLFKAYQKAAAENARDGELEVDDHAPVSLGDDPGAYVNAWLWVPKTDLPEELQELEPGDQIEDSEKPKTPEETLLKILEETPNVRGRLKTLAVLQTGMFSSCPDNSVSNLEILTDLLKALKPIDLIKKFGPTQHIPCFVFEYDLEYSGGNYSRTGNKAYVPSLLVQSANPKADFAWFMGIDPIHVVYFNTDELTDYYGPNRQKFYTYAEAREYLIRTRSEDEVDEALSDLDYANDTAIAINPDGNPPIFSHEDVDAFGSED